MEKGQNRVIKRWIISIPFWYGRGENSLLLGFLCLSLCLFARIEKMPRPNENLLFRDWFCMPEIKTVAATTMRICLKCSLWFHSVRLFSLRFTSLFSHTNHIPKVKKATDFFRSLDAPRWWDFYLSDLFPSDDLTFCHFNSLTVFNHTNLWN